MAMMDGFGFLDLLFSAVFAGRAAGCGNVGDGSRVESQVRSVSLRRKLTTTKTELLY
jgi:hypothetical protein